jgi:hypothetical protein
MSLDNSFTNLASTTRMRISPTFTNQNEECSGNTKYSCMHRNIYILYIYNIYIYTLYIYIIYIIYIIYTQYILQDWYICLKIRYPEISWSITICGIQTTRDTADTPYFQSAFGQALWSYYKSHRAEMVQLQRRRAVLERANAQQNAQPKNTESHEASLG